MTLGQQLVHDMALIEMAIAWVEVLRDPKLRRKEMPFIARMPAEQAERFWRVVRRLKKGKSLSMGEGVSLILPEAKGIIKGVWP